MRARWLLPHSSANSTCTLPFLLPFSGFPRTVCFLTHPAVRGGFRNKCGTFIYTLWLKKLHPFCFRNNIVEYQTISIIFGIAWRGGLTSNAVWVVLWAPYSTNCSLVLVYLMTSRYWCSMAGLSAGMRRERVSPQIRKKERRSDALYNKCAPARPLRPRPTAMFFTWRYFTQPAQHSLSIV